LRYPARTKLVAASRHTQRRSMFKPTLFAAVGGIVAMAAAPPPNSFSVAEVKPHFGCRTPEGQEAVRGYIAGLANQSTGLIALIQYEFSLPQPSGYTAFGASCTPKHADPVVVLVDNSQFGFVEMIGDTVFGDYASMPFLTTGKQPSSGSMCTADPKAWGARGYAGAVLRQISTGKEVCVIAGTFPHCNGAFDSKFSSDIRGSLYNKGCGGRPLLFIVDTNAGCQKSDDQAGIDSSKISMTGIGKNHSQNWGECSDPAIANPNPTCCNDIKKGHPEARVWYDRTALCGGGTVEDFQVHDSFVCGADEEHKFTTATVTLGENSGERIVV